MWCWPSSCSTSFMAAKIGRSGQPMQKPGGRGGTILASSLIFGSASTADSVRRRRRVAEQRAARAARRNALTPSSITCGGVFAGHRQHVLAVDLASGCRGGAGSVLSACSMIVGLAFLDDEDGLLVDRRTSANSSSISG